MPEVCPTPVAAPVQNASTAAADLTICSVSFRSAYFVALNRRVTKLLNPGRSLPWVVVENSPPESPDRLFESTDDLLLLDGCEYDPKQQRPDSYHHALGLNKALQHVRTRYVLVLDPDFFIIARDWVRRVLDQMRQQPLAVFGAPWHPKYYTKWRYFPCAYCLLIDLDQISRRTLDFRPSPQPDYHTVWAREQQTIPPGEGTAIDRAGILNEIQSLLLRARHELRQRRRVGQIPETADRIYHQYFGRVAVETLVPVYRPAEEGPQQVRARMGRWLDAVLPDQLALVPKRSGSFTTTGFRELGHVDTSAYGWEEFLWNGSPFAFHIRGWMQRQRNTTVEIRALHEAITDLTGLVLD